MILISRVRSPFLRERVVYLGILGTGFSLLLLLGMFIICRKVAPQVFLCYGVSAVVAFLIAACVFCSIRALRH